MIETLSQFTFGDTTVRYRHDNATGRVGIELFPTVLQGRLAQRRESLAGLAEIDAIPGGAAPAAFSLDPLVQVKIVGDNYTGGFAQGHTMRASPSNDSFRYSDQAVAVDGSTTTVVTVLASARGHRIEHRLSWHEGDAAFQVSTVFHNDSDRQATLEMLSSFSLGGLTPFHHADAPDRLLVHRFRSAWSAEGRLETRSVEQLHLERSWSGAGAFSERFGQVGSMPVRRWFPFVAIEDTDAGVVWGAQLAWAGSWQMEVFRKDDPLCISGGLADREFGHWMKTLGPGESLAAPPAAIACAHGTLDDLCDRITALQQRAANSHPQVEHGLPIIFNEWCTTWGDPSHDSMVKIAGRLAGSPVKYLVIDAGWYKGDAANWDIEHGDWTPNQRLFPNGLASTAAAIRAQGLIPGLWFEFETCGTQSAAFSLTDHLLRLDGIPLTVRDRRFWDLNDTFAVDYLTEKVIGLLQECGFGYLKVDYNEAIGLGCDGAESHGEGLRRQIVGVYRFFERIRERLPDLVIENCSSGGHRLEPSMLARTAMSSFSDAHELKEIPIIAANLQRLMLPRQSQVWAVLRPSDSDQRLAYSLAATFLGRMCLSGDIVGLSEAQWALALDAQALYRRAAHIVKSGVSRKYGLIGQSWRHPEGWQGILRVSSDGGQALAVLHAFGSAPKRTEIRLPAGKPWRLRESFPADAGLLTVSDGDIVWEPQGDFSGTVALLARD